MPKKFPPKKSDSKKIKRLQKKQLTSPVQCKIKPITEEDLLRMGVFSSSSSSSSSSDSENSSDDFVKPSTSKEIPVSKKR